MFINEDLEPLRQFVVWKLKERKGKKTKIPYDAKTGGLASSTDPDTWASCYECLQALETGFYEGIGVVFCKESRLVGIDLDHCFIDGALSPFAEDIVNRFGSYTELSPSGDGLHILVWGELPGQGINRKEVEMYDSARFFTLTGDVWDDHDIIVDGGGNIRWLYEQFKPAETERKVVPMPNAAPTENIVELFRQDEYCNALWNKAIPHKSQSEYDLAITSCALQRGFTHADVHELIATNRNMWGENPHKANRADYIGATIGKAMDGAFFKETQAQVGETKPYFVHGDYLSTHPKKLTWVIKQYIPESGIFWVAGQWSTYKSFLALHECYHIALGKEWCGNKTKAGNVVYVAGEGFGGFGKRLKALEETYGEPIPDTLLFTPTQVCLNDSEAFRKLVWRLKRDVKDVAAIFIDTKSANMQGSDSDPATMNDWITALRQLQQTFDCAIVVVDHVGHIEKGRPRGASQQMGAADAVYMIERSEDSDHVTMRTEKDPKDFNSPPPLTFKAEVVDLPPQWNDEDDVVQTSLALVSIDAPLPTGDDSAIGYMGKSTNKALGVLQAMYAMYEGNIQQSGGNRIARVEYRHWRNECLSSGISKSTLATVPKSLEIRGLITRDDMFVYLTERGKQWKV